MKSQKEKLQICSTCKKRSFDPNTGIICSLTYQKPTFDDECPTFDPDAGQIERQKSRNEPTAMSGWLKVFIWLGIGAGAILSSLIGGVTIAQEGFGWIFSTLYLITILALDVIAVAAIIAFYRGKSNAVALANTYIAMIALDGLFAILIAILTKDNSFFPQAIRQFAWSAIWFTYLQKSDNVEALFPAESRSWKPFEKVVLAIYVLTTCLSTIAIAYAFKNNRPQDLIYSTESYIDLSISEANKELPTTIDEGLTLMRISKENDRITYTYRFDDVSISDFEPGFLDENTITAKQEALYNISQNPQADEFATACANEGYTLIYEYMDRTSVPLYSISIRPEEFKAAMEAPYKCPTKTLQELIDRQNDRLPLPGMAEDASLLKISLAENDSELIYKIRLPEMSREEMSETSTASLREHLVTNWDELVSNDPVIRLATINQLTIRFDFSTSRGLDFATVRIAPEVYNFL